jgi:hypothetical protein
MAACMHTALWASQRFVANESRLENMYHHHDFYLIFLVRVVHINIFFSVFFFFCGCHADRYVTNGWCWQVAKDEQGCGSQIYSRRGFVP